MIDIILYVLCTYHDLDDKIERSQTRLSKIDEANLTIKPRFQLAEYVYPIVYDRDNWTIANNLKPIGTVIVFVEKKFVASVLYFEIIAYLSEPVRLLS